jgi:hypothetical protein
MKILPYAAGFTILLFLAFALYVRSVPAKEPKGNQNMTPFADLGQTPYDAVPPGSESAGVGAESAASAGAEAASTSDQSAGESLTIEL